MPTHKDGTPHPGARWRRIIWERHETQRLVAERMKISAKSLSQIINGHVIPTAATTILFALATHQDPRELWADVSAYTLSLEHDDDES